MPIDDDGPLRRDLERLSGVVERLTHTLENLPDRMAQIYVRQDVYNAEQRERDKEQEVQDREIEGLNSIKDWAIRIILGVVLVAMLGLVVTQTGGA